MERSLVALMLAAAIGFTGCKCCDDSKPAPQPAQGGTAMEVEEDEDAGKESPVDLANLPANVRHAAEAAVPGLKVVSSQKEEEDGKPVFEVSGTVDGTGVEVLVTPEGEVLCIERVIAFDKVPEPVKKAAEAKVPGLVVAMAEEIKKSGATQYELKGKANGRRYEVKLSEAGEVLEVEE